MRLTTAPGDAERFAREWAAGHADGAVLVAGGDGSVHEAVNGLLAVAAAYRLGVIPTGSGNDFARNAGIPLDPERAAAGLGSAWGGDRRLDVGRCAFRTPDGTDRTRCFVNSLSTGVSARANRLAFRMQRIFPGPARYPLAGLAALVGEGAAGYVVSSGGRTLYDGKALNLTLANGACFGGGLRISPASVPDDGALDLVIISAIGRLRALVALSRLRRGTHLAMGGIRVLPLIREPVRIARAEGLLRVEADGENFEAVGEISVEILPARLRLLI